MVRSYKRVVLLAAFLALAACGGESGTLGPFDVGPNGGTIYLDPDSIIAITFPAGALSQEVSITAVAASGPASNRLVPGTVWDVTMTPAETLALDATVRIKATQVPAPFVPSELRLWKVVNGAWQQVPGSAYNAADNTVTASLRTFSVYGVLAVPVAQVTITKPDTTLTMGDAIQVTAVARDAQQVVLPNRTITWTSLNPSILSVNASGMITAQAVGQGKVTGDADGASDTITITVVPATSQVWLEESFLYSSTTEMIADPRNIYTQNEDLDPARIFLDTEGFDGVTNSMRYDYPDRTGVGGGGTTGRCGEINIGRNLTLPTPVKEVWAEFYVKFSANFTTIAPAAWACTSGPSLKLIFGRVNGSGGRFSLEFENAAPINWTLSAPGLAEDFWKAPTTVYGIFDGTWHRIRLHYRISTTATSADGGSRFWLDNDLAAGDMTRNTVFSGSLPTEIYGLALGRNLNQGPGQAQSLWWGRIRVYQTDPGW